MKQKIEIEIEIDIPEGYEATGEYRVSDGNEPWFDIIDGYAQVCYFRSKYKVFILRKKKTLADRLNFADGFKNHNFAISDNTHGSITFKDVPSEVAIRGQDGKWYGTEFAIKE